MSDSFDDLFPSHAARLEEYFSTFSAPARRKMKTAYGLMNAEPETIAKFWLRSPDKVRDVVREKVKSSVAWRVISEAALEHDLGLAVDWVPKKERKQLEDLGLMRCIEDSDGFPIALMPAPTAAIFADQVTGHRGSLVLLLGRAPKEKIDEIGDTWFVDPELSWLEKILQISEQMSVPSGIEDILESLPSPGWIGDAMMVMELGGLCFWQQIFGYDIDPDEEGREKVVPLMRRDERQYQQEVAETLMSLGILFRLDGPDLEYPMLAVPEELWMGLWDLGMQWLTEWVTQGIDSLETSAGGISPLERRSLQPTLKWLLCEAKANRLTWEGKGFSEKSQKTLEPVYEGDTKWQQWADFGFQYRIFSPGEAIEEKERQISKGHEARSLLDRSRLGFFRECILEWCVGYNCGSADRLLGEALGIDEEWRQRALALVERHAEMFPMWMTYPGVETSSTGGGWLRESDTGTDQAIVFESVVASTFVTTTKLGWLDMLSLLEPDRLYSLPALAELMQCCAATAMFTQLGVVLGQQPAAVYLPFQRSSFLMDELHFSRIEEWVKEIFDELLVPLGIAHWEGTMAAFEPAALRIQTPAGWPEEERLSFVHEIWGDELLFDIPDGRDAGLREVATVAKEQEGKISIYLPLEELLKKVEGKRVNSFDGIFLHVENI